jgi:hypothetical protein
MRWDACICMDKKHICTHNRRFRTTTCAFCYENSTIYIGGKTERVFRCFAYDMPEPLHSSTWCLPTTMERVFSLEATHEARTLDPE